MLNWFKNLFKSKEEAKIEVKEEPKIEIPIHNKVEECYSCKEPIELYQKIRHFGGVAYHKSCWRLVVKQTRQSL